MNEEIVKELEIIAGMEDLNYSLGKDAIDNCRGLEHELIICLQVIGDLKGKIRERVAQNTGQIIEL